MKFLWLSLLLIAFAACQQKSAERIVEEETDQTTDLSSLGLANLSAYGFFKQPLKNLEPTESVIPYQLNSPLFSDYAFKKRFIKIPNGKKMIYNGEEVFDFPAGTVLIKNFYYPADFGTPDKDLTIIETRLLIKDESEWKALVYVWNNEQTEAYLEAAGKTKAVSWTDDDGLMKKINYSVPNLNQCKSCHMKGDKVMPIGPTARQLNMTVNGRNQLVLFHEQGKLSDLPNEKEIPKLVSYNDKSATINDRARAWLEVNCAHCHRPDGPAKTSGLHLQASVTNPVEFGIGKAPVAAGKGSGGLLYDIVPGKPDESILFYRINATDPGVMMPELGRTIVHKEGVELIREWIFSMK